MPVKAGLEMVILGTEQLFSEEVPIPFTSNVNVVILPQGIMQVYKLFSSRRFRCAAEI